jgi:hypothetical protein
MERWDRPTAWVAVRRRDGMHVSIPADRRIAEGVKEYMESHSDERVEVLMADAYEREGEDADDE